MGNDDKFVPDDDEFSGATVTRKMRKLEDMGVLDKPPEETKLFGRTSTIKTYPFVKTKKSGLIGQLFEWFKKN